MTMERTLLTRSNSKCELCGLKQNLSTYDVPPYTDGDPDHCVITCEICRDQIEHPERMNPDHWRCLNESMWSEVPAVQVVAWRMLNRLTEEVWPLELLDILYLDEDTLAWAKETGEAQAEEGVHHIDSNGAELKSGDTVTLTKDLTIKGANFTAKRGTAVNNIAVVPDNPEHIEGRIGGQQIPILTKFVKKVKKD